MSALVTGGGSGIGLGCAARLARDGAHVTICGRTEEKLQAGAEEIEATAAAGASVTTVACDVTDEESVAASGDSASGPFLHDPGWEDGPYIMRKPDEIPRHGVWDGTAAKVGGIGFEAIRSSSSSSTESSSSSSRSSLSSMRAHHRRGAVHWPLMRQLSAGIVLGGWLGGCIVNPAGRPEKKGGLTAPSLG